MNKSLTDLNGITIAPVNRARWNVLDILEWISRKSKSAYIFCDVNIEPAQRLAEKLSARGEKITVTTVLLKAISIAQLNHPDSRSYIVPWGGIIVRPRPVAGFTVERDVDGQPAVFFASIRDPDKKTLLEIGREVAAYAHNDVYSVTQLAKETLLAKVPWILRQIYILIGRNIPVLRDIINPSTFGLTSLGKFGSKTLVAPNVTTSIFGIGGMEEKPVCEDGKVVIKNMMSICLSADGRVLSIYSAARFMNDIKILLESGLAGHLSNEEMEALAEDTPEKTEEKQSPVGSKSRIETSRMQTIQSNDRTDRFTDAA